MRILATKTYYSPTFLDHSRTYPDKKGNSRPTGKLEATIFTRVFSKIEKKNGKVHITAQRSFLSPTWEVDTDEAKADAIGKAIEGMSELELLDKNPPIDFIPDEVADLLSKEDTTQK